MVAAKPKLIAIVGPTGSGKTALAIELARRFFCHPEQRLAGRASAGPGEGSRQVTAVPRGPSAASRPQDDILFELVSADSRQVYRGMDIGTGKERVPDVPQHLIDIVDSDEEFTLAHFLDRAKRVIADIHARGRIPIVVGGTGLYVQALVENWDVPEVKPDKKLRAELEGKSVDELHCELAAIDPEEAERLGRGKRYLVRALEIWRATERKPSELKKKNEPLYDVLVIGISAKGGSAFGGDSRDELYARIDARVDDMFARGLVDEVRGLLKKYPPDLPAFNTIGYREVIAFFSVIPGERSETRNPVNYLDPGSPFQGVRDDIKNHTHQYARRQLTWLRRMKYIKWVMDVRAATQLVRRWLLQAR